MNIFLGELVGTLLMILLGNGVVANVLLSRSKGAGGGWVVICLGWGFAVTVSIYLVGILSSAHLNPAVTLAFALSHGIAWNLLPIYWLGQFLGAFLGAIFVWLTYYLHFRATVDAKTKLLCFATAPAIYNPKWNAVTEMIATAALIVGIFGIVNPLNAITAGLGSYLVGILVVAVGLCLGGPTGYAINPARDLGPRLAFGMLYGMSKAEWKYAWVPGIAPLGGAVLGFALYKLLF